MLTQTGFHLGFHVQSFLPLLPLLSDALVDQVLKTGNAEAEGYEQVMGRQTPLYADALAQPWVVLCALPHDALVWLLEGEPWKGELSAERVRLLLRGAEREAGWLRSLDGRFETGGEKLGHLWNAQTVISFLAARAGLRPPTLWATWDATFEQLQQVPWEKAGA